MQAEPFSMDVELGKVREFAAAVRADGPGFDLTDGHPPSSPTFLMSAAFWRRPEHYVVDHSEHFSRTLHAAEEFTFPAGPPRAGTKLLAHSHLGSITKKEGRRGGQMTFTEVVTVYTDECGSEVARNISTTVLVERPPQASPAATTTCGDQTGE